MTVQLKPQRFMGCCKSLFGIFSIPWNGVPHGAQMFKMLMFCSEHRCLFFLYSRISNLGSRISCCILRCIVFQRFRSFAKGYMFEICRPEIWLCLWMLFAANSRHTDEKHAVRLPLKSHSRLSFCQKLPAVCSFDPLLEKATSCKYVQVKLCHKKLSRGYASVQKRSFSETVRAIRLLQ